MVAFPVFVPVFNLKKISRSPVWLKVSVCCLLPFTCTPAPEACMDTFTFFTLFSNANTLTGTSISSPILSTRGSVERIINGVRTGAVFSTFPYAPS